MDYCWQSRTGVLLLERRKRSWVYGENGLYLHEYGHIKDRRLFGPLYLPVIGIFSASGDEWTEIRANNNVWNYLRKRRLLDSWDRYEWRFSLK